MAESEKMCDEVSLVGQGEALKYGRSVRVPRYNGGYYR